VLKNRPFSTSKNSHFQNKVKCKTCENGFYLRENENHFQINRFAPSPTLKESLGVTPILPINSTNYVKVLEQNRFQSVLKASHGCKGFRSFCLKNA